MATVFSRIIAGEIPCYKIAENDRFIAFLDVNPVALGHALVVPKQEVDYLFDLDPSTLSEITLFARDVAAKIKNAVPCLRIGLSVIGLEVPHAHIHLVPLNKLSDINFEKPRLSFTAEEYTALAKKISES
jgi:histidine triad (HIT) family protein